MNNKIVPLKGQDFGDDVATKEVAFLRIVEKELEKPNQVLSLPRSLAERIQELRDKANRNFEAEAREM